MVRTAGIYARALYELAIDEGISGRILEDLELLEGVLGENPRYGRLLSAPSLSKQKRCGILDQAFRGKLHPYVLNFLKLLTQKGYIRHFPHCCRSFRSLYNEDNGILPVRAESAFALNRKQRSKLSRALESVTGRKVDLQCTVDPSVLGGLRLRYGGKLVEGTVESRLDAIGRLLKHSVL